MPRSASKYKPKPTSSPTTIYCQKGLVQKLRSWATFNDLPPDIVFDVLFNAFITNQFNLVSYVRSEFHRLYPASSKEFL